ncbi:igE-binding protein-like [Corticium candelabrum]|uniref:igE-binding protein-like n=1 Tax=Corticium candelabrum TaxID=121492 RepID=UPI002E26C7D6|nr:igE-binding protein-like [Corticium candelabrum]
MDLPSNALGEGACLLRGTIGKIVLADDRRFLKVARSTRVGHSCHQEQTVNAMRRTFSYHGLPRRLVTDNGPQFRSHEFQMFMKANGIRHQLTPPYHPSSNGRTERLVQELKFEESANREIHQSSGVIILTAVSNDTKPTTGKPQRI